MHLQQVLPPSASLCLLQNRGFSLRKMERYEDAVRDYSAAVQVGCPVLILLYRARYPALPATPLCLPPAAVLQPSTNLPSPCVSPARCSSTPATPRRTTTVQWRWSACAATRQLPKTMVLCWCWTPATPLRIRIAAHCGCVWAACR